MNENLYNQYRPAKFADISQPFVTKVLQAQIATGNHPSTFLFYGPSGCGKTTVARVMAMALLCENLQGSEPCGECHLCEQVRNDHCRDYTEINCGTNGKVEEARELITERLRIPPANGKWKIILLDEAQCLTSQAMSALLKSLEEPPPYIKIFLCTTDKDKISDAIQTRCEQHEMSLVSDAAMLSILEKVVQKENITADDTALGLIVEAAGGSVRKALVQFSQVLPLGITEENVRALLKRAPRHMAIDLLNAIGKLNRAEAYMVIETAVKEGRDIGAMMLEAARILMTVTRYKVLRVRKEDQDPDLALISYGGTNDKGDPIPGFTPSQIVDVTKSLIEISTRIRQNVPADVITQVSLLTIIDRFAKMREAAKA